MKGTVDIVYPCWWLTGKNKYRLSRSSI